MRFLFWLVLCSCGNYLGAQIFNPRNYDIVHYTSANGLPQNSIRSIVEDDNGFIWMATEFGVCRYDGQNFAKFNHDNLPLIKHSRTTSITHYNKDTLIFFDAIGNSYFIVDSHIFIPYVNYLSASFRSIIIDTRRYPGTDVYDENLLAPHKDSRHIFPLYRLGRPGSYSGDSIVVEYFEDYKLKKTFTTAPNRAGNFHMIGEYLLVLSPDHQSYALYHDGELLTQKPMSSTTWLSRLPPSEKIDPATSCYVIKDKKLYSFSLNENQELTGLFLAEMPFELEDWGGAAVLVSGNRLFIGSKTSGLFVYKYRNYRSLSSTNDNNYAIFPINDSILYTATSFINVKTDKVVHYNHEEGNRFKMITGGWDSTIYFIKHYQLLKRSGYGPEQLVNYACIPGGILGISQLSADTIFVISQRKKLFFLINENRCEFICDLPRADAYTECILVEHKKIVWLAGRDGVVRVDLYKKTVETIADGELAYARSIYKVKENIFLIGTYGNGAFLLRNGKAQRIPSDKDGYLSAAHCFVQDQYGCLWISTNNGILKTRLENIIRSIGHETPLYFEYYGETTDPITELNGGCSPCAAFMNKKIYFPSLKGVVVVSPSPIHNDRKKGIIIIDNVYVDNTIYNDEHIRISNSFQSLQINFSGAFVDANARPVFYYRNGNISNRWIKLQNNFLVFYSLPEGNNKIELMVINGLSDSDVSTRELLIYVKPPFYNTWPFRLAILLVLVIIFFVIYNYRLVLHRKREKHLQQVIMEKTGELQLANQRLTVNNMRLDKSQKIMKRNNVVRDKLISVVTHEVKSPLYYFHNKIKHLLKEEDPDPGNVNKSLLQMERASLQTYETVERIAEWVQFYRAGLDMKKSTVNVRSIFDLVSGHLEAQIEEKQISIINDINPALRISVNKTLFLLVVNNLVSNAVKFTESGTIHFTHQISEEVFELRVADTGIGMSESQIQQFNETAMIFNKRGTRNEQGLGLGLYMISEIVHDLEGEIILQQNEPGGTIALVQFPSGFIQPSK